MLWRSTQLLVALAVLFALFQWATWPDVGGLAEGGPTPSAFIERHRLRFAGQTRQTWVPYDLIAAPLKHAVVVSEDMGFFSHRGFAFDEIRIALRETLKEGRELRGASTISQQVAKNLWLSTSRNPLRKGKEAILTLQLERALTKRRILEIYLNVAQFGPDVFGAEAAARAYFGISAAELSAAQAAELAAGLPQPRVWNPSSRDAAYRRRVERLRARMERSRWVLREL